MSPTTRWFQLTPEQQEELNKFGRKPGWEIVPRNELPTVLPEDFRVKIDSAVVIRSETSTGGTYLVFDNYRVDAKAGEIDQEPFGLIVHSTGPGSSGVLIHHGTWPDRTYTPPAAFWDEVSESGIGDWFYANPPAGAREGPLETLPRGNRAAFNAVVRRIRARVDGRK